MKVFLRYSNLLRLYMLFVTKLLSIAHVRTKFFELDIETKYNNLYTCLSYTLY